MGDGGEVAGSSSQGLRKEHGPEVKDREFCPVLAKGASGGQRYPGNPSTCNFQNKGADPGAFHKVSLFLPSRPCAFEALQKIFHFDFKILFTACRVYHINQIHKYLKIITIS